MRYADLTEQKTNRVHKKAYTLPMMIHRFIMGVSEYLASYLVTKSNCGSLIRYTVIHKDTIHKLWIDGYSSHVGAISHVHAYGWGANTTWAGYIIAIPSDGASHGKLLGAYRFWGCGLKGSLCCRCSGCFQFDTEPDAFFRWLHIL